jgi:Fe-S-cluster containining protein
MTNNSSYEELIKNRLELDDTFDFKCTKCGKCCKNRDDLILTPYDIFRLAKHLQIRPRKVIRKYCEVYIGANSRLPIVRMLPRASDGACPFLRRKKCSVHEAKPIFYQFFII